MAVLNKKTSGIPAGAIYIGRGSKWGNPFAMLGENTRDLVCDKYEDWMGAQLDSGSITLEELASLHGRDLVCFCAPKRCHGHSLEHAARWAANQLNQE